MRFALVEKITCPRCGNDDAEILRRGQHSKDVLFCPYCDDICNTLEVDKI